MSQFVVIQIGQCGNQIGSAFWPLVLHECGIQTPNGNLNMFNTQTNCMKNIYDISNSLHSFLDIPDSRHESQYKNIADLNASKAKARAILIDMEDSVVSRFQKGPLRKLFDHSCLISNYPGSANNWAMGHHTHGREYRDKLENVIRHCVEKCDSLHGFLLVHSLGGGTGSGLGTATLRLLNDAYPNIDRCATAVYPAGTEDVITAPYNVLLATRELAEYATCVFPVENKALLEICSAQMSKRDNMDQARYNALCMPFQDMNTIIANMLLHVTSGSRFPGSLNIDMNDIATNLVPYPKLHFLFSSVSPISILPPTTFPLSATKFQDDLFSNAWSRNNQLLKINPLQPGTKILAAAHIARGNTTVTDIKRNMERFRKKITFTAWSNDVMKIGLCSVPAPGYPASVLCLLNSSAMSLMFKTIVHQFMKLYKRKAHVHHYTQICGFEEANFTESKETVFTLYQRYKEIQSQKILDIPRLEII